jgi:hypothetical protein
MSLWQSFIVLMTRGIPRPDGLRQVQAPLPKGTREGAFFVLSLINILSIIVPSTAPSQDRMSLAIR